MLQVCRLYEDLYSVRSRYQRQGQVITSYISCGMYLITCRCSWYLPRAHKSSNTLSFQHMHCPCDLIQVSYLNVDWIWVRSQKYVSLVAWFCYQLIAKPGNKTATPSWPDPYYLWISIMNFITQLFQATTLNWNHSSWKIRSCLS